MLHDLKSAGYASLLALALAIAPAIANAHPGSGQLGPQISQYATFQLTSDHCTPVTGGQGGGGCGAGGSQTVFGTIVVTDMGGGTLEFHVTLLNGNTFVNTGFPLTLGFNLVGNPLIAFSGLTSGFGAPVTAGPLTTLGAGSYDQDGTGFFEYGVLWGTQGDGNGTAGPLDFDINATGLTLASLEKNADGQFFAVDIRSGTTGATGNVDASSIFSCTHCGDIPEPNSLALLAIGLFALYALALRRRR